MLHTSDMLRWRFALVVGLCLSLTGIASAQEPTRADARIDAPADMPDHDREIYQLVSDIMQVRLQRTLGLDTKGFDTLMTCLGGARKELVRLKWQRGYSREALRACVSAGEPDDVVAEKLSSLLSMETDIVRNLRSMVESSEDCLNAQQTANLYLFVDDFEAYLGSLIDQARDHGMTNSAVQRPLDPSDSVAAPEDDRIPNQNEFVDLVRRDNQDARLQDYADDDVVALVDALLILRLTERLGLTSNETAALFKRVGDYKDQLHRLKWIIGEKRGQLRDAIESQDPDGAIRERVEDLLLQEEAVARIINMFIQEAREDLTIRQAADLYLFLGDFEEYIVGLLGRANMARAVH